MMTHGNWSRRDFLRISGAGAAWLAAGSPLFFGYTNQAHAQKEGTRVIALGLDGMDPKIIFRMIREGKLPTFKKVAEKGYFGPLQTTTPPQSPVAWASFITGCNPGKHGIFDFIHRNPKTYLPYLSTSRTQSAPSNITISDYQIPISSGKVENLRKGRAFWEILAEHDIPVTVFKMPSNFPPSKSGQRTLSGMGTPDILGSYGIYSYFTDNPKGLEKNLKGARIEHVTLANHQFSSNILGPKNSFRVGNPITTVDFTLYRDPVFPTAKLEIQNQEFFLNEGEWSPWIQVAFKMAPTLEMKGICRFYLKSVHPDFKLYVTAVHIDPSDPAMPISTPDSYASELYKKVGFFHTKGLPADTKALDHGVLDEAEFLALDELFLKEKMAILDFELERFESGVLFYYISSPDQRSHMFWRLSDPKHPSYDPEQAALYGDAIEKVYQSMDRLLEKALAKVDDNTLLLAFSDHGFAPYYRSFHLNSWLLKNGYLELFPEALDEEEAQPHHIDWGNTRAYAMGFNGLYINLKGREGQGIVSPEDHDALVDEIARGLENAIDPLTRKKPVLRAERTRKVYAGPYRDTGPDIIVGYDQEYRGSWQTALGSIPKEIFAFNHKKWSGDHCMCADVVPGMILSNRELKQTENIALQDVTATILQAMGVSAIDEMDGKNFL